MNLLRGMVAATLKTLATAGPSNRLCMQRAEKAAQHLEIGQQVEDFVKINAPGIIQPGATKANTKYKWPAKAVIFLFPVHLKVIWKYTQQNTDLMVLKVLIKRQSLAFCLITVTWINALV